jgi:GNAT superfamily N-acetyltransferase
MSRARRNPTLQGTSQSLFVEVEDNPPQRRDLLGELWIYDPENQDDTYAVVVYGNLKPVQKHAQEFDEDLAQAMRVSGLRVVAYWSSIEIAERLQRGGLGVAFVKLVLAELAARGVQGVYLSAHRSIGFWQKQGFVRVPDTDWFMPGMFLSLQGVEP